MLESSFIKRKVGPLPMWAWMLLGVGAALAYVSYRNGKTPAVADASTTLPADNLGPLYVFQNYDQNRTYITVPEAPPGGGRPTTPPTGPPASTPGPGYGTNPPPPPVLRKPPPVPSTPIGTNPPKPPVLRTPPPPAPAGVWVDVVKWTAGQPKGTPSTLWGIAEKAYGNGGTWQQIWNAPQNAAVRGKRGTPEKIQQGDRFWVPTK